MCSSPTVEQEHDEFYKLLKVLKLPVEIVCMDSVALEDTEEVQDVYLLIAIKSLFFFFFCFNNH